MDLSAELIAILTAIWLAWSGWISIVVIKNQRELSKLNASDVNLHNDMEGLKEDFKDMRDDIKEQINKLNQKFDIFLRDEISFLKDLARK